MIYASKNQTSTEVFSSHMNIMQLHIKLMCHKAEFSVVLEILET